MAYHYNFGPRASLPPKKSGEGALRCFWTGRREPQWRQCVRSHVILTGNWITSLRSCCCCRLYARSPLALTAARTGRHPPLQIWFNSITRLWNSITWSLRFDCLANDTRMTLIGDGYKRACPFQLIRLYDVSWLSPKKQQKTTSPYI